MSPHVLRPATFRARLGVSMAGLAIVVLMCAGALIYAQTQRALRTNLDHELLTIARTEAASEFDEPGVGVHVHELAPGTQNGNGDAPKLTRVIDGTGRALVATANLGAGPPLIDDERARARALAGEIAFAGVRRGDDGYRAVYYPITTPEGASLAVMVALPTAPLDRTLRAVLGGLALSLLLGGIAAAWGAGWMARYLTSPLEFIAAAARTIRAHEPGLRIPEVSSDTELRTLTSILNEMLAGLEEGMSLERQTTEAQRRFVADAAHELRSPLTNLRGTIEVTLRRPRSVAEYQEALTIAAREIERLSRLANDLLTLSRIDAGQPTCQPAPCDLGAVARDAIVACADRALSRRVELSLRAPAPVPIVGDPDRLRQVFDNLLDNGLRYAPEGSTVTVTTEARDGAVVLAVADAGPGLTAEQQTRVFDRFYRADDSRARSSGGHGLGLPIAKAIVEAHHGTLTVQSTQGGGCTFVVMLPAADGRPAAASDEQSLS
jgi:two-component system OmpR family sensor kinase